MRRVLYCPVPAPSITLAALADEVNEQRFAQGYQSLSLHGTISQYVSAVEVRVGGIVHGPVSVSGTQWSVPPYVWTDDDFPNTPSDTYAVEAKAINCAGTATATDSFTVRNLNPTIGVTASASVAEGQEAEAVVTIGDAGPDTLTVTLAWGDGQTDTFTTGTPGQYHRFHTYQDDDPTATSEDEYTILATVADDDSGTASASTEILVSNAAPTVNAGADRTVHWGTSVLLTGSLTDPGAGDTHVKAWEVLDECDTVIASGVGLTFSFTPPTVGSYHATLTVTDDDGGFDTDTATIAATNAEPVAVDDDWQLTDLAIAGADEFNPLTFDVLDNDDDPDGDPLAVVSVQAPADAAFFSWSVDGTVSFAPPLNWSGIEALDYTITDGVDTATATLVIRAIGRTSVDVDLNYPKEFSVTDGDLVDESPDGEFTYAPKIPFQVLASVADNAGDAYSLAIYAQGIQIASASVGPGEYYENTVYVAPELANSVTVSAELIDPFTAEPAAADEKSEAMTVARWTIGDSTVQFQLDQNAFANWAAGKITTPINDALAQVFTANAIHGAAVDLFNENANDPAWANWTVADYENLLNQRATGVRTTLSDMIKAPVSQFFSTTLLAMDHPTWIARLGANSPAREGLQRILGEIPSALERGVDAQLQQGQVFADDLDKFLTLNLANPNEFFTNGLSNSADELLAYIKHPNSENLGDIIAAAEQWKKFVLVKNVRVNLPLRFGAGQNGLVGGYLTVSAKDLSFETLQGDAGSWKVEGGLGLAEVVTLQNITIYTFAIEGSWEYDLATHHSTWDTKLGLMGARY